MVTHRMPQRGEAFLGTAAYFPASSTPFPLWGLNTNTQGREHKPTSVIQSFPHWKILTIRWLHSGLVLELLTELRLLLLMVTAVTGLSGKGIALYNPIYSSQQTHTSEQELSFCRLCFPQVWHMPRSQDQPQNLTTLTTASFQSCVPEKPV